MSSVQPRECQPYWNIFEYSTLGTCCLLIAAFAAATVMTFNNRCALCLRQITLCLALANAMLALQMIKSFQESLAVVIVTSVLYYVFLNNAYWLLVGRYLLVVRGNKFVMKGERIPDQMIRSGMVLHMIVVLLLTLFPIGYGVFLLYCKINPYKVSILGPKEFRWFQSFSILNCSVQVLFGLTLFFSIFVALKQLRQNGFK